MQVMLLNNFKHISSCASSVLNRNLGGFSAALLTSTVQFQKNALFTSLQPQSRPQTQRSNSKSGPNNTLNTSFLHQQHRTTSSNKSNSNNNNNTTTTTTDSESKAPIFVKGRSLKDSKTDLAQQRIGEVLIIPYEVTASDFWRELWQSTFYQQDRIHTSLEYVTKIKDNVFEARPEAGIPMPFSQMLYAATSMPHIDDTRNVLDLAFRNCVYEKTVFPGDTLTRHFKLTNMRHSSNNENILLDLVCKMYNQFEEVVFRLEKTMYFEKEKSVSDTRSAAFCIPQSAKAGHTPRISHKRQSSTFKKFLLKQQRTLPMSISVEKFHAGQVILHTLQRPIGYETSMNLSMLHRMTHPMLYNTSRYKNKNKNDGSSDGSSDSDSGLVVGGVPLIALTHSFASKELHEIVYEELLDSHVINRCLPDECMGAFTYIMHIDEHSYELLEEIECVTIGVKHIDVIQQLENVALPLSLFEPGIFPRDVERICEQYCPLLRHKIVVHSYRKLLRHKPAQQTKIPLL